MYSHYLMQFFETRPLTHDLQLICEPYQMAAKQLCKLLPDNPETTTALRKLLESRDAALRATVFKNERE